MINRNWDLKQQTLQMNWRDYFHLHRFQQALKNGNQAKIQNEKMSPPKIEPAIRPH